MLLKSMATGLFSSGCWTQGQLFEYHATLMQTAEVSPRQVRIISLQTYGVHNAQEQRKMRVMLDISRASWCETLALQALGDGVDHDRVRSTCSRIEQPGVSVHAAGAHRPTSVQLAEMASP